MTNHARPSPFPERKFPPGGEARRQPPRPCSWSGWSRGVLLATFTVNNTSDAGRYSAPSRRGRCGRRSTRPTPTTTTASRSTDRFQYRRRRPQVIASASALRPSPRRSRSTAAPSAASRPADHRAERRLRGDGVFGLRITAGRSTVRAMAINRFGGAAGGGGISLETRGSTSSPAAASARTTAACWTSATRVRASRSPSHPATAAGAASAAPLTPTATSSPATAAKASASRAPTGTSSSGNTSASAPRGPGTVQPVRRLHPERQHNNRRRYGQRLGQLHFGQRGFGGVYPRFRRRRVGEHGGG